MAFRSRGIPRESEYRCVSGLRAASIILSTMCFGVAPSGLPMPKSIMSSPRARAAAFISLVMLKTYGGRRFNLKNSCIGLVPVVLLDTLIPIALCFERMAYRGDMRGASRFECDVYDCIAQIDAVISTIVQCLDNVCPLIGKDFRIQVLL